MDDEGYVLVEDDVPVGFFTRVMEKFFASRRLEKKFTYQEPPEQLPHLADISNMEPILVPPLVQETIFEPEPKPRGKTIDKCRREILKRHKKHKF